MEEQEGKGGELRGMATAAEGRVQVGVVTAQAETVVQMALAAVKTAEVVEATVQVVVGMAAAAEGGEQVGVETAQAETAEVAVEKAMVAAATARAAVERVQTVGVMGKAAVVTAWAAVERRCRWGWRRQRW